MLTSEDTPRSLYTTSPPWTVLLVLCGLAFTPLGCGESQNGTEGPSVEVVPQDEVERRVEATRNRLTQNEGGRRVLRAIEAHGGLEAWYRAPTSSYTWEYANTKADLRFRSFLVVDNRTRQVYHDLLEVGSFDEARPVDARFAWDGERAWMAPDSIERPNPRFWALSGFYFQQIPFVLADPGLQYEALPDETLDGEPHDMVRVSFEEGVGDSPDDIYTLYLDKETGRVDAIRYAVTYGREVDDEDDLSETFFAYQDYVTVDGLTVPTQFKGYTYSDEEGVGDALYNEAIADSISYRRPFDESKLTPPDNARFVEAPGDES